MSVTINSVTQLVANDPPLGIIEDIKIEYTFTDQPSANLNVSLEVESTSGNWMTCWDCIGSISTVADTTSSKYIYWQSPEQYGVLEGVTPQFKVIAFYS